MSERLRDEKLEKRGRGLRDGGGLLKRKGNLERGEGDLGDFKNRGRGGGGFFFFLYIYIYKSKVKRCVSV